MRAMRILVISDSCDGWNRQFIECSLAGNEAYTIDFLSINRVDAKWMDYYGKLGVTVLQLPDHLRTYRNKDKKNIADKIAAAVRGMHFFSCLKYDIINYQFVSATFLPYLFGIKNAKRRLILSYWGSDLLRQGKKAVRMERLFLYLKGAAFATFDNMDLRDDFFRKYRFPAERGIVAYFGDPILDEINRVKAQNKDIELIAGQVIPKNRMIIAVGYNGREAQQHLKVIEQLSLLKEQTKTRILILLQMTYGGTDLYLDQCIKECRKNGLEVILFDKYLECEDVAKIRLVVDVYINAQVTDAFAGSFCEYLYTDTHVFNASWLHYKEIDNYSLSCDEYGKFEELPGLIEDYVNKFNRDENKAVDHDRKVIWKLRSNKKSRERWKYIFEKMADR